MHIEMGSWKDCSNVFRCFLNCFCSAYCRLFFSLQVYGLCTMVCDLHACQQTNYRDLCGAQCKEGGLFLDLSELP